MMELTTEKKMYYTLRVAMAMCLIGHGAFGVITKAVWCNYFAVFGIGTDTAYRLMPPLGLFDISLGLIILLYPVRAALIWLMFWGLFTALLRPLSGEPVAELIERAGNFGPPLAMLLLTGRGNLFAPVTAALQHDGKRLDRAIICLKVVVFLLLAGHGWLNLLEKKALLTQYASLGMANPARVALTVGVLEIMAAFAVLIRPVAGVLLVLLFWKISSELFYPHYEFFEWIERGGSYGSILALYFGTRKDAVSYRLPKINFPVVNR